MKRLVPVVVLLLAVSPSAQQSNPDIPESGSSQAIAAATTEPRFLSPWVSYVPDHATIPSPREFLGRIVGAPGELTKTDQLYAYYRALASATPRVRVETIGKTEEGRDLLLVIVGDERHLADLDRARTDMARLADPRETDADAAEEIIARVKPFYMLHAGIHSPETGSPEMLLELAYRLAVSDAPWIREIRDDVIVLINPVSEADGRDRMVDWFYRHLKGKTDFDNLPPRDPPYWGKYVVHDNNRDSVQRKLALTRATQDAFMRWHPIVVHDLHESIPLLSIWTGTGPYNPNVDPVTMSEWHAIAFHEVTSLTSMGMPGVWTYGFGEGFAHIYADSVAINHNAIGKGYETFGNATAETVDRVLDPEDEAYTGRPVTEPDWYRPSPPPRKLRWSLRNNVNYMQTGVLSALQYTARNGKDMLRNFWRRGYAAVEKGRIDPPFAVVVPEAQSDRRRLADMINLLRAHGIEVSRSRARFTTKEGTFAAGTFVVRMDQPYRGFALDLLLPQNYPIDKARYPAYDDVTWALPVAMGIETTVIADASIRNVPIDLVSTAVSFSGSVAPQSGGVYLIRDTGQQALYAARVRLAKFQVEAAERQFSLGDTSYPAGSWIIASQPDLRPALESIARDLSLDVTTSAATPQVARHPLDLPRLALLQTWRDTESAGWVRMILDEQQIPYAIVMDDEVRAGGLQDRYDVILMPNTYDSLKNIIGGIDPKFSPLAYTRTAEFPTHGWPTSSPDITGGMGWRGVGNLEDFVRRGGLLVTLGGASTLPLDGGIARDVSRAAADGVDNPGSALRALFRRPDHPIGYGYSEKIVVHREDRPLYAVRPVDDGRVVLQWGTTPPPDPDRPPDPAPAAGATEALVVSGGVKGAEKIAGKPAILDIPTGRGRIIAFNFDPIHRYQTTATFRLVWNAILNWNDLPPTPATPPR
jgi:hypothetical protein